MAKEQTKKKPAGLRQRKKEAAAAVEEPEKQPEAPAAAAAPKLKGLKKAQVLKAAAALLKHLEKQRAASANLLEEDEFIYLACFHSDNTLALTRFPQERRRDKPIRLRIPHPILQFEGAEVCLFVKDRKGEGHKEAKARVKQQEIAGISKVIGLSKLRTKYEAPEAKRALCNTYDVFLADDRILPSLPKAIGKSFFAKKKQPLPVNLRAGDWGAQVRRATEATYMFRPSGNSLGIRVARSSFSAEQCRENVLAVLAQAVQHVPDGWEGIRAAFLKSADSVALPVFQRAPEVAAAEPAA